MDAAGDCTWLTADERGSIIALSDDNAAVTQINKYDEYGKPQPTNVGRFQYTGQAWLGDLGTSPASGQGLYYQKSRMYAPHLGRNCVVFLGLRTVCYRPLADTPTATTNEPGNSGKIAAALGL
ncbi:hypothetical protein ACUXST_002219 [Sphingomonas sp. F9_3S_D5_B_2]